jgi:hypothetical protein
MRLGHWGGGIDYRFRVPPRARFEAGIGYRGMVSLEDLHEHPRKARMRVEVGVDGAFETVLEHRVSDVPMEGRRWTDVAVDLSRFEGQEITLRLAALTDVPTGKRNLSWWASPRIVVGDATAQAGAPTAPSDAPAPAPPPQPGTPPAPERCADLYAPVCGVDGRTWPNRCEAERAGARVAREGPCEAAPPPPAPRLPGRKSP